MAAKGGVQLIISDPGTQLKGANKELITWRNSWDHNSLIRFGAERGIEWLFIMPDAQHQNGSAEIMVKLVKGVKQAFMKSLGEQILSLYEMMTLMCEISNLVNQRPIGIKPNSYVHPEFLSPNSLYLGRCSDRISSGPFAKTGIPFEDPKQIQNRFRLVQAITDQFWKNWNQTYFPTLLVQQKWHTSKRNVRKQDICLLKDDTSYRSDWRLAKVTDVYPDQLGRVRNVELLVMPRQNSSLSYKPVGGMQLKRHVSKLIVLVPYEDQEDHNITDESKSCQRSLSRDSTTTCDEVSSHRSADNDPLGEDEDRAALAQKLGGTVDPSPSPSSSPSTVVQPARDKPFAI